MPDALGVDSTTAVPPVAPVRTCVGCRRRATAAELLRVVASGRSVVPDPRRRAPGRGAWVHPDPACLDLAERRRAYGRALRVQDGPLDPAPVREYVTATGTAPPETPTSGTPQE